MIGKGLSANETLKVLKVSGGNYGNVSQGSEQHVHSETDKSRPSHVACLVTELCAAIDNTVSSSRPLVSRTFLLNN